MKRMRVFKKMAVLIVLSVVLSAPSNVIYAFAEEYIDESESVDYEQSNLIENEESVENNQSDVKISEEVSSEEVSSEEVSSEEVSSEKESEEKIEVEGQNQSSGVQNLKEQNQSDEVQSLEEKNVEIPSNSTPGWLLKEGDWYYYDLNGTRASGWRYIGNVWYYFNGDNISKPGVMSKSTHQLINGNMFVFDASGAMQTGWILEPEGWYYADGSGALANGWRYVNGAWYYLDGSNTEHPYLMLNNTKKTIAGCDYYFANGGAMRTGWILEPEGWYYADGSGALANGWRYVNGAWYYLDGSNTEHPYLMLNNTKKTIAGCDYYFANGGAMRTGWILEPEGWYYADGSGALANGWRYVNGAWYYLDGSNTEHPYLMLNNTKKTIAGCDYYFANGGAMRTGWILEPEGWYYAREYGTIKGWLYLGNLWYYLDGNNEEYPGLMVSGQDKVIAGEKYSFNPNGDMRAGWYMSNSGEWYYYDNYSGQICSGWKYVNNNWYYLDPQDNNKMIPGGWKKFDNGYYLFNSDGSMVTNWSYVNGNWYYFSSDGLMRTGWQWIGNKWYYFYYENDSHGGVYGAMARATSIDGWQLQTDGSMLTDKQAEMSQMAQAYNSNTNYLILVDRAACKVAVYAGRFGAWNNIMYWDCAPGKASTPTVSGTFTVQGKGYYFDSGSARCYWYTQFYGNYLFHSVLYSKYNGSLMDGRVGIPLSHGCVRLQIDNAKWIYDNIPRGTKVVIY